MDFVVQNSRGLYYSDDAFSDADYGWVEHIDDATVFRVTISDDGTKYVGDLIANENGRKPFRNCKMVPVVLEEVIRTRKVKPTRVTRRKGD